MAPPLTKLTTAGDLYVRPPSVEANIDGALKEDRQRLRQRLHITDHKDPDYLRSECLVHLVRWAHRAGDDRWRDEVFTILFGRCEAILKAYVARWLPNAESIINEVLSDFGTLVAIDGVDGDYTELDFYECRFNRAFATLRYDAIRRETGATNRNIDPLGGSDPEEEPDIEKLIASASNRFHVLFEQEGAIYKKQLLEAIQELPWKERHALILVRVLRYEEESKFPEKRTAATILNCSGRTIRNLITRAEAKLARLKEEQ